MVKSNYSSYLLMSNPAYSYALVLRGRESVERILLTLLTKFK